MINQEFTVEELPWLSTAAAQLRRTLAAGRMPHGLFIQAAPGLGMELLARWTASLAICAAPADAPCGRCKSCVLLRAGNHPDFHWVARIEDAKQLQVDQIRELCAALALKSYGGGYKVAVIADADYMNANAANALLKTLEEPPPQTLLILCVSRPSRLPATIISRCQKLKIARPAQSVALAWLTARRSNGHWEQLLEHAAGAPLRALELAQGGFAEFDEEMSGVIAGLRRHSLNVPGTAERWAKGELGPRLEWFETWVTTALRTALLGGANLPSGAQTPNIRRLFRLLDRIRSLKLEQSTSLNMQLAAEGLLLGAEAAVAS